MVLNLDRTIFYSLKLNIAAVKHTDFLRSNKHLKHSHTFRLILKINIYKPTTSSVDAVAQHATCAHIFNYVAVKQIIMTTLHIYTHTHICQ